MRELNGRRPEHALLRIPWRPDIKTFNDRALEGQRAIVLTGADPKIRGRKPGELVFDGTNVAALGVQTQRAFDEGGQTVFELEQPAIVCVAPRRLGGRARAWAWAQRAIQHPRSHLPDVERLPA